MHPKLVPQMAGAEEVFAALALEGRGGDTTFAALVLNRKGLERAVGAGAGEIHVAYPLTDTFAQRNQNMTVDAAAETAIALVAGRTRRGRARRR